MILLDKDFLPVAEIDSQKSLIWHNRYYGVGSFELHTISKLEPFNYVYLKKMGEVGIVEDVQRSGENVIYKGRHLKSLLENKVISATQNYTNKTPEYIAKDLVNKFYGQYVEIQGNQGLGTPISIQVTGDNLLEFTDEILSTQNLSAELYYDYATGNKIYKVTKGEDNTEQKPPLSSEFETILSYTYLKETSKYKNFAFIAGEELENQPRTVITVDLRGNQSEERREIWVDARDLRSSAGDSTLTSKEYEEVLYSRGISKLNEQNAEELVEIVPNENAVDKIELGEWRTFKSDEIITTQQITEVITGIENGITRTSFVLGLQNKRGV